MPTLGEMTPLELVLSAREDLRGLDRNLEAVGISMNSAKTEDGEPNWLMIYSTALASKLIVLEDALEKLD